MPTYPNPYTLALDLESIYMMTGFTNAGYSQQVVVTDASTNSVIVVFSGQGEGKKMVTQTGAASFSGEVDTTPVTLQLSFLYQAIPGGAWLPAELVLFNIVQGVVDGQYTYCFYTEDASDGDANDTQFYISVSDE